MAKLKEFILKKGGSRIFYYWVIFLITFMWTTFVKSLNGDEVEHLHFAYLVGSGQTPYIDFFQHHLPLIWYLFSFIFYVPTFLGKIIISKIIISAIWTFTVYLLDTFSNNRYSLAFTLLIVLIHPWYDYLQIRPEVILAPLLIYFVNLFQKPGSLKPSWLLAIVIVFSLYLTPRFYLILFLLGIYLIISVKYNKSLKLLLKTFLFFLLSLLFFDTSDILFFVFDLTKNMTCNYLILSDPLFIPVIISSFVAFFICLYKRDFILAVLVVVLMLQLTLEKAPFIAQATLYLVLTSFFIFSKYINFKRVKAVFTIVLLIGLVSKEVFLTNRFQNRGHNQIFTNPSISNSFKRYKSLNDNYKDFFYETLGNHDPVKLFHPIFNFDYSYFSFANECVLGNGFKKIIKYNSDRGRKVLYFQDERDIKYIDPRNKRFYDLVKDELP